MMQTKAGRAALRLRATRPYQEPPDELPQAPKGRDRPEYTFEQARAEMARMQPAEPEPDPAAGDTEY